MPAARGQPEQNFSRIPMKSMQGFILGNYETVDSGWLGYGLGFGVVFGLRAWGSRLKKTVSAMLIPSDICFHLRPLSHVWTSFQNSKRPKSVKVSRKSHAQP